VHVKPRGFVKDQRLGVESGVRLGDKGGEGGDVKRFIPDVKHAMAVSAECSKGVKKGKTIFLCAGEKKNAEAFAAGESDNVASHSFTRLG